MTMPHAALCDIVFDLMSPARLPGPASLAQLDGGDWDALLTIGKQHRILPLIHHRLRGPGQEWPVPAAVRNASAASFRRYSVRAMRTQRALARCLAILAEADIGVTALKGAWLAFHAYPLPGLRPLRDLDLLVARDHAQSAFDRLVKAGFTPVLGETGDLRDYMRIKHQLPPLRCPETGICVELHHRCLHGGDGAPDLPDDPGFHARLIRGAAGGYPLTYMGREHLLLHLVIHSALDHTFDNGPSVLPDVAMLLASGPFDWACFWSAAERFDAEKAALLVLTMAERLWGVTGIDWQGRTARAAAISPALVQTAARLALRDLRASKRLAVLGAMDRQPGLAAKARFLLGKVFPRPLVLRAVYPGSGGLFDLPRLYVLRWRDMVARRMVSGEAVIGHDRADLADISVWLGPR